MISKSWRLRIFNWFGAGVIVVKDHTQEYKTMSNYVVNGGAQAWSNGTNGMTLTESNTENRHNFKNTITIKVTPATGGHIVSVSNRESSGSEELHVIPEGADFDRELGKIITYNGLKQ